MDLLFLLLNLIAGSTSVPEDQTDHTRAVIIDTGNH